MERLSFFKDINGDPVGRVSIVDTLHILDDNGQDTLYRRTAGYPNGWYVVVVDRYEVPVDDEDDHDPVDILCRARDAIKASMALTEANGIDTRIQAACEKARELGRQDNPLRGFVPALETIAYQVTELALRNKLKADDLLGVQHAFLNLGMELRVAHAAVKARALNTMEAQELPPNLFEQMVHLFWTMRPHMRDGHARQMLDQRLAALVTVAGIHDVEACVRRVEEYTASRVVAFAEAANVKAD